MTRPENYQRGIIHKGGAGQALRCILPAMFFGSGGSQYPIGRVCLIAAVVAFWALTSTAQSRIDIIPEVFPELVVENGDTGATNRNQHSAEFAPNSKSRSTESSIDAPSDNQVARQDKHYPDCKFGEIDECDLAAQQSMAESTRFMNYAAWIGVFLTVLGIALIYKTMLYTRDAATAAKETVIEARSATAAAIDTINVTRDLGIVSARAYVHYDSIRWISHRNIVTGQLVWRLRPAWKNTGATPTRSLRIFAGYPVRSEPLPTNFEFSEPPDSAIPTLIEPGGRIESGFYDLLAEDLLAVQRGEKYLYVWGVAVYRDIFPNTPKRVTRFCLFATNVMGNPMNEWNAETNQVDINFSHYERNNCADEDCF